MTDEHVRFTIPRPIANVFAREDIERHAKAFHVRDSSFSYCKETMAGLEIGCSVDVAMIFVEMLGSELQDGARPAEFKHASLALIQTILERADRARDAMS